MDTSIIWHIAFTFCVTLAGAIAAAEPEETNFPNAPIVSVTRRKMDVFASTKVGIFHADEESRHWRKLELPKGMPLGGQFAKVPDESAQILYVASGRSGRAHGNETSGIYASRDAGETWKLLSANDDYGAVILLSNGSLFAVSNPRNSNGRSRVHLSKDMGQTWRDITETSFGDIFDIFEDPDHSSQICLRVCSIREYIVQAEDEQYQWKATPVWLWHPERFHTTEFFRSNYSTGTILYMLPATLNNYFHYDFGDRVVIPPIQLSTDMPRIVVTQGDKASCPVTIRFLEDTARRRGYSEIRQSSSNRDAEPTPTTVKLVDIPSSNALWGIRVAFQGQQTAKRAKARDDISHAKDRDAARRQLMTETALKEISLASPTPYRRELDLTQLHDFTVSGTYRVQLTYDNNRVADGDKGHWVGTFSSPVFEVVVEDRK